ncbi:3-carboxy-cis,cis-muconate cyclo-isomerase [Halteromyces radiatus]|uniref:3-carboxy-cis,cis-muconate cyclo-isomerase n=1 Tax=Halteromyces radiatus TaxID=101107 RepID=UPI002221077F|nr:3-carboxy-cis,cis-muconate cyclo-isomerase [Halteromyces radiatus]KAI8078782.1 3-carboxy-cis,cis-muconate cyclo-isomerase [Halteromyces radiatus]
MSTVIDSHIFKDIFGTSAMRGIWSDETRTNYYLEWEVALAKVQSELGIIPVEAYEEIKRKATLKTIDMDELKATTELIGYPVLGVVRQLVAKCERGLGEYCHFGATTQDVTDSATVMQIRDGLNWIDHELDLLMNAVTHLATTYRDVPMVARSNLQQAVPITFGFKMARLLATLQRHKKRLDQVRSSVLVLEFGGAAGTLASLGTQGLKCQELLAKELGLEQPEIAWHTERDRIADVGCFLAMLCGTLSKNATDIKLMMQTEVGEVSEKYIPHRGSSSTMPNKFNPISCVYIHSMASTVRQHSAALLEAMVADHERSTGNWEIEWIVLPEAFILTSGVLSQSKSLMEGLTVHPQRMTRNLNMTKGLIVSEAVMMGLADVLGRQTAHDIVYDLCRQAVQKDCMLIDLLKQDERVIKATELAWLERLCDPTQYVGLSCDMVDRVLMKS